MDYSPLVLSLQAAGIATMITFVLGIYIAYFSLRLKRFSGVLDGILTLPLVLPPTVVGFLLLLLLGKRGPIGILLETLGTQIIFTGAATIISAAIVSLPLMYRTVRGAMADLDENLIQVARTLGLKERTILWKIMIPNTFSSIISGTILSFARALGEFGATIMIAGNIPGKTQTMSIAVYSAVQAGNRSLALKWVLVMAAFSLVAMLIMNYMELRSGKQKRRKI